jgi:hypothetical protein
MPRGCLAGWRPRRLRSRGPPHWPPLDAGPASRRAPARPPSLGTDPATGVACPLWLGGLSPAGRWASGPPVRQCPAAVAWAGSVLPSRPSPCRGLAPPLRPRREKTPHPSPAGLPCDRTSPLACPRFHRGAEVPAWCRGRVSPAVPQERSTLCPGFPRPGASGASHVLRRLSSCMPRPEDAGGPAQPGPIGGAPVACGSVKTLGVRHEPCRSGPSTAGCAVTPTASRRLCRRFAPLVRRASPHDSAMDARRDTGGWLALTRQGLSPCKRRQAYLGAITPGVRRRR